jgi:hypothetical protein
MPSSPISKDITLPDNWVQLQKTMIPDQATACYWSVWYDVTSVPVSNAKDKVVAFDIIKATAWLMWCAFGDDPSVNDNWGHVEDLDGDCKNALTTIESVYGVSFHESVWKEISPAQTLKDNPIV